MLLNGEEEFELGREFVFRVEPVAEVYSSDPAIGVNLHSERLDVVGPVGTSREVAQIKLDLVPPLVQSHRHRADKRLHSSRRLIVARSETSSNSLVIQYLYFESEVLLQLIYIVLYYIILYINFYICKR